MATVDIDPAGDVIVEIGEELERVRVSSKTMSLTSPVFRAMFNSGFREGLTAQTSSSNPSTISLPDDDLAAFLYLGKIMHFQKPELPPEADIEFLEKVTGMYDKYQFTTPIAHIVEAPLDQFIRSAAMTDLYRILFIAYLLDAPQLFSTTSWEILITHPISFESMPAMMEHPSISTTLRGE
ncbi:hypothetical protein H2200_013415 [Cladophialophora chaetospira]|uniref:BTB domain-containing protein n=1 Tax=Cladophialophora chaetospira TaxID=386627 RepID=A0AA38U8Z5_9EURO|nr:hypothetical protein H2200_013415 [Cladophialophora chaetospira]